MERSIVVISSTRDSIGNQYMYIMTSLPLIYKRTYVLYVVALPTSGGRLSDPRARTTYVLVAGQGGQNGGMACRVWGWRSEDDE
jgi:hypothetical protein